MNRPRLKGRRFRWRAVRTTREVRSHGGVRYLPGWSAHVTARSGEGWTLRFSTGGVARNVPREAFEVTS